MLRKKLILIILLIVGCDKALDLVTEVVIEGCTTTTACNYDADATKDDGSCTYAEENYDCAVDSCTHLYQIIS